MCPNKLVFKFECKERQLAMKLVEGNYGEEDISCNGYAPNLYEVIELPLNWKAVVMERLSHDSSMPSQMEGIYMCFNVFHISKVSNRCEFVRLV